MRRLAIVEDDPEIRADLVDLFERQSDFDLGPLAGSAEELFSALELDPQVDLVLADLGLPDLGGVALIERLRINFPGLPCVAHTALEEPETVLACLRAGAAGYLLKGCSGEELIRGLRTLEEGGAPLTPRIARLLLCELRQAPQAPLSERELEVLAELAQGLPYKAIAIKLVVSAHTVHTHVKRIYNKLGASGRRDAVAIARRNGWLDGLTTVP